jgi:hypothetical protein
MSPLEGNQKIKQKEDSRWKPSVGSSHPSYPYFLEIHQSRIYWTQISSLPKMKKKLLFIQ